MNRGSLLRKVFKMTIINLEVKKGCKKNQRRVNKMTIN